MIFFSILIGVCIGAFLYCRIKDIFLWEILPDDEDKEIIIVNINGFEYTIMGWRDRHPFPMRDDFESEEDYQKRLKSYYDAEDAAAEEYIERKKIED